MAKARQARTRAPDETAVVTVLGGVTVLQGDCVAVMRSLADCSVDVVVTDPPYGLEFMGKDWDAPWKPSSVGRGARVAAERADEMTPEGRGHEGSKGPYLAARVDSVRVAGLPFQKWCQEWAAECLRVLKPGGHLAAFGGTRTFHRLTCAIEDAGFEIRDCLSWMYGSGFPKSLDVSKAIDKRPGVSRHAEFAAHLAERRTAAGLSHADVAERVVGTRSGASWNWEHHQFPEAKWWPALRDLLGLDDVTWGPVIAEAERAKVGENGRKAGWFAAQDGHDITAPATEDAKRWEGWGTALKPAWEPIVLARKPLSGTVAANVLAHRTGALNIDGCRLGPGHDGDARRSGEPSAARCYADRGAVNWATKPGPRGGHPSGRWPANVVLDEDAAAILDAQVGQHSSTARGPRGAGPRVAGCTGSRRGDGRTDGAPGETGGPSRFFYCAKASRRDRGPGNTHPTVKPVALMRWLIRLITPSGGIVLDPFAGSGTTGVAAIAEGVAAILIERETEYLAILESRLETAATQGAGQDAGQDGSP